MATKHWILFIASFVLLSFVKAQNKNTDSANAVIMLKKILLICKDSSAIAKVKAAPYIVYKGNDEKRAWKSICNYNNPEDKKRVDEMYTRIKKSTSLDSNYKIIHYLTEKESEGVWYILVTELKKNGELQHVAYAFLKLDNHLYLGDIELHYD
jgi:hypothetical protein